MDMPSHGCPQYLDDEHRTDEFFVLLSDAASQFANTELLRRVLGADTEALDKMADAEGDHTYHALRNLHDYSAALARLAVVAIDRYVKTLQCRPSKVDADAKTNDGAAPIPEAAMAA